MAGTSPAMTTRVSTVMAPNTTAPFASRGTPAEIETGTLFQPRFDADGLIPAVVQETETGEVLMVAWMNREALEATLRTGGSHFWSRSRRALWRKGETSGHVQHVDGLYADCDGDTLLVQVHQEGVACHTGARTCFFTRLGGGDAPAAGAVQEGRIAALFAGHGIDDGDLAADVFVAPISRQGRTFHGGLGQFVHQSPHATHFLDLFELS